MTKTPVVLSPTDLIKEMEKLAHGRGGLIVIPLDYWTMLAEAYDSLLMKRVQEIAMPVFPVREVDTKQTKFRTVIDVDRRSEGEHYA